MTQASLSLKALLAHALDIGLTMPGCGDNIIRGVTANSEHCRSGFLFVATKGATPTSRDGHDFIDKAIGNGACAVVCNRDYQRNALLSVPLIRVADSKLALCQLVEAFHDFPSRTLKVVGITGTNGKTSTTFMLHHILKTAGYTPRVMGTLGIGDPGALTPLSHTTMDPAFISAHLAELVREGISHVAMEVSSHALSLKRIDGLYFAAVGLTNITQDHLDFHETLENYRDAKARLFFDIARRDTIKVLPDDHPFGVAAEALPHTFLYAQHSAHELAGMIPFYGDFHLKNALLALTIARALDVPEHAIREGLKHCPSIPGRLEKIAHAHDFTVFVDFAHTPHALAELLATVRRLPHQRLIVVFGCGGDREKEKRPMMGRIASEKADVVIITDDNPRTENPCDIRQQILSGVKTGSIVHTIDDRRHAIDYALRLAKKNDLVVIAGKGHENYQTYGSTSVPFSDQDEARKVLQTL